MFLDKVISVLPKIGGIAGRLLTEICNDEEGYIQYDLPNPTQNGADGDTTPAIFTNENGKILLTNHALRKSRYVLMHFPASPLADLDDIAIPGSFQADVSRRFHEHAQYNDGQFELSTYDADAPKHTDGPNSLLNHVSKSGIPTDGTAVSFGAGFLISVNGDKLTIQSKYNDLIEGITKIRIVTAVDGETVEQAFLEANVPDKTFIVPLTFTINSALTPVISVEANICTTSKNANGITDHLQRLSVECTQISENTKRILAKGRRLN